MESVLLIDDDEALLAELESALGQLLAPDQVEIRTWLPRGEEDGPRASFDGKVDGDTLLVVTDYDLTRQGQMGLFGSSIVDWCQGRGIPVGDFSRGHVDALPREPNLFEMRIPNDTERGAKYIAAVVNGFRMIKQQLDTNTDLLDKKRSPAAVLAQVLGAPDAESQFSMYGLRLSTSNAALLDKVMRTAPDDVNPERGEKKSMLTYIVGHLLLNAILRFPGPILSVPALAAHAGCDDSESELLQGVFADALYGGPFRETGPYYWLDKVTEILREVVDALPPETSAETNGELHREALETRAGRSLLRHSCSRCDGVNGGFYCPLTRRTVCLRADCSIGSNSWLPQGARLCRIERDFYEEWAPLLGI